MGSLACSLDEVELHDTDVKLLIFSQSLFDPVAQMDCQDHRKHIECCSLEKWRKCHSPEEIALMLPAQENSLILQGTAMLT